jgi:flagellar hook protein FlgE
MERLESALYTSREGLVAHGTALAVVGDNIANVSTVGFKHSRPEFATLMGEGFDGRNSDGSPESDVGSGVKVTSVRQLNELGVLEVTGRTLDIGIDGNGYFLLGDPTSPLLSRAGNLQTDVEGNLVNSEGFAVLGYAPTDATKTTLTTLNLQNLSIEATPTTLASMTGNLNSSSAIGTAPTAPTSFNDLAAQSTFTADLSVVDSLGASHDIKIAFTKTASNSWVAQAYIDGSDVGGTAGVPVQLGANTALTFNATGGIDEANAAAASLTIAPAYSNGAAAGAITLDLSPFRQQAAISGVTSISENGAGVGQIKSYQVQKDGTITAQLSSGEVATVGTLALGRVPNPDGLERVGNNMFRLKPAAGDITSNAPGVDGLGGTRGESLERSTVDISVQFTEMILLQRGYQGNSQIMNAANELLQQTLGLMR